jgi:DNA-binding transcriptional LysR family regulator
MRLPQVNIQQLVSFYFVAKEKNFRAASEKLFVTQPAVTQQIKALEGQFGVKLIRINKQKVYLTKAGARLLDYAEVIVNHATMAENFLKSYRVNNFRIGVATTITLYLTPAIDKFKEIFPSVMVSVREAPSFALIEDLIDFKFDVCVTGTLPRIDKRLHVTRMPEVEQLVLVAAPDHVLTRKVSVKWEDLVGHPLILQSEGSAAREVILQHFARRNLTPTIGTEVDNTECAKQLALQKKGVALMFLPSVKEELARGRLTIIPTDGMIRMGIDIVTNQDLAVSPLTEAFMGIVKKHFNYYPESSSKVALGLALFLPEL